MSLAFRFARLSSPLQHPLRAPAVRAPLQPFSKGAAHGPVTRAFHARSIALAAPQNPARSRFIASAGLLAGGTALFGGALAWDARPVECDAGVPPPPLSTAQGRTEAKSIVNLYELSFGTVCGLCAGIFIKKGLKLVAVLLGGTYVLMQYLASRRVVAINWSNAESIFNSTVDSLSGPTPRRAGTGVSKSQYPLVRMWNRLVEFLTADFQQRATFIAGLVLGLRVG
ncbi:hypothetical protein MSPP1_000072 [Malassezia sp. CBS 17886]|nr:hypothetical protein MSPP1_000072 [Malassezia sp. CBS 17886]